MFGDVRSWFRRVGRRSVAIPMDDVVGLPVDFCVTHIASNSTLRRRRLNWAGSRYGLYISGSRFRVILLTVLKVHVLCLVSFIRNSHAR